MKIKLLHLYHDWMNLYGESGNIKAIRKSLEEQGMDVQLDCLSIEDTIDFMQYDFVYIGSGTKKNQAIALQHILAYQEALQKYIESGKVLLATGNGFEFFGKKMDEQPALGILDFSTRTLEKRKVGDFIQESEYGKIVAFENRESGMETNAEPFLDAETGVHYQNFYGMYLLGPVLVRNPGLHRFLLQKIVASVDSKAVLQELDFTLEEKAVENYLKTYYENEENGKTFPKK